MLEKIKANALLTTILVVFTIGSLFLIQDTIGVSTLTWMKIYAPEDFIDISPQQIYMFFRTLRIPIPPILGLGEILSLKITNSTDIITNYFYKFTLISSYILSICLANKSPVRLLVASFVSTIFLYATTIIHPGNSQVYDVSLPFFFLFYIFACSKNLVIEPLLKLGFLSHSLDNIPKSEYPFYVVFSCILHFTQICL